MPRELAFSSSSKLPEIFSLSSRKSNLERNSRDGMAERHCTRFTEANITQIIFRPNFLYHRDVRCVRLKSLYNLH